MGGAADPKAASLKAMLAHSSSRDFNGEGMSDCSSYPSWDMRLPFLDCMASLLSKFRQYYVTAHSCNHGIASGEGLVGSDAISLNDRCHCPGIFDCDAFLSCCPAQARPFLSDFFRTKMFAGFLSRCGRLASSFTAKEIELQTDQNDNDTPHSVLCDCVFCKMHLHPSLLAFAKAADLHHSW